jgi:hypothetical protein
MEIGAARGKRSSVAPGSRERRYRNGRALDISRRYAATLPRHKPVMAQGAFFSEVSGRLNSLLT